MPQHRKVAPLSDQAFRLHITAAAWSSDEGLDGFVPKKIPETLTSVARGKRLAEIISELEDAGLWDKLKGGHRVHNFLKWNYSAAELAEMKRIKSQAGRLGGIKSGATRRSKKEAAASRSFEANANQNEAHSTPLHSERSPQPPERGGQVRKVRRPRYKDAEEERRVRNRHASDILDGFFGRDMQEAAHAARGRAMAMLVDKVERGEVERVRLNLALPAGAAE
jgi:hypothetical protein